MIIQKLKIISECIATWWYFCSLMGIPIPWVFVPKFAKEEFYEQLVNIINHTTQGHPTCPDKGCTHCIFNYRMRCVVEHPSLNLMRDHEKRREWAVEKFLRYFPDKAFEVLL